MIDIKQLVEFKHKILFIPTSNNYIIITIIKFICDTNNFGLMKYTYILVMIILKAFQNRLIILIQLRVPANFAIFLNRELYT